MTAEYTINAKSILRALKKVNAHHWRHDSRTTNSRAMSSRETRTQFAASFKDVPADADIDHAVSVEGYALESRNADNWYAPAPGAVSGLAKFSDR
jgi:hypothetical protein